MNMNMNRLPVPTWNHLGVNFAPAAAALPLRFAISSAASA